MFKLTKKNLIPPVVTILVILFLASFIPPLKSSAINTLKFPLVIFTFIGREVKAIVFYHHNFIQYERLNNELGFLRQRLNTLEETKLENSRLKKLLSLKQDSPYKVIAARVIARSADNWASLIAINKGRHHGIRTGFVVTSFNGLVGRVVDAGEFISRVMLLNDPNLSVSALDQRSRQEGLVCGTLGNSLIMKYLSRDADINPGDTIITSGLTHFYPKGLMIGQVIDVGQEFSGLSKYAIIKPAANLSNIEEVLIIIQ